MTALVLAGLVGLALSAVVILADVWEERRRAQRRHHALQSFYERAR
jgi:hypothetical protein